MFGFMLVVFVIWVDEVVLEDCVFVVVVEVGFLVVFCISIEIKEGLVGFSDGLFLFLFLDFIIMR